MDAEVVVRVSLSVFSSFLTVVCFGFRVSLLLKTEGKGGLNRTKEVMSTEINNQTNRNDNVLIQSKNNDPRK